MDLLAGEVPTGRRVVADWGGDPPVSTPQSSSPRRKHAVTLAVASVTVGETVHQYRETSISSGCTERAWVLHHRELVGAANGAVELGNVFARELHEHVEAISSCSPRVSS